ncbi:glycosyltransferase family 4 protein [Streptomyces sp. 6N223]
MERHVECLTREQVAAGHQVSLAFRHGACVPDGAAPIPTRPCAASRVPAVVSDRLAFAAQVARALRGVPGGPRGVDLVHLHGDHVEALVLGPACRRLGVPLIVTVHATLSERHRRLARHAFRHVAGFVALGEATAADLRARGVEARRILAMSSGLELSRMPPPSPASAREPGLIVSVGALNPMKDHGLLIEAFHRLARDRRGLRLVIAGDGPERDRLGRLAAAGPGVKLAGALPREEVYDLLGRAQVFVLASRRLAGKGEGVPTAALEALALGTPVIVSSHATLDPVVTNPNAYRVFASGSADSLVAAVATVLDDASARERMGTLGRQAAEALDWPVVARRVEEWYATTLRRVARRDRGSGGRRGALCAALSSTHPAASEPAPTSPERGNARRKGDVIVYFACPGAGVTDEWSPTARISRGMPRRVACLAANELYASLRATSAAREEPGKGNLRAPLMRNKESWSR